VGLCSGQTGGQNGHATIKQKRGRENGSTKKDGTNAHDVCGRRFIPSRRQRQKCQSAVWLVVNFCVKTDNRHDLKTSTNRLFSGSRKPERKMHWLTSFKIEDLAS